MRIYVASSWKNERYEAVCTELRNVGHTVLCWRENPFQFTTIDPNWEKWTSKQFIAAMHTDVFKDGCKKDLDLMYQADMVLLLLPCGRSAHLEMGWAVGVEWCCTVVLMDSGCPTPELMYGLCDAVVTDVADVVRLAAGLDPIGPHWLKVKA